jgi:DNA-binding HxlR family transcriptional regulator
MSQEDFDKRVKYFHENMPKECPILYSMSIIGSKWKIPVMWYLMLNDGQHYNELKRSIGAITNTMLTKSLRELEKDGLLKRVSKGTVRHLSLIT